jgi:hypothetical protein
MGLKGYRLLAMGQLDSNVQSPTTEPRRATTLSCTGNVYAATGAPWA